MVGRRAQKQSRSTVADGRAQRGARSHQAIANAVYELVGERGVAPTVAEVAERAGVGVRTVFRQFQDSEALFCSLHERLMPELLTLARIEPATGELLSDVAALVSRRARVFEYVTPFRHAGSQFRPQSPFLQSQNAAIVAMMRAALQGIVGPHLGSDGKEVIEALDAVLCFETWDRLRQQQRLSAVRAEEVLVVAVLKLIGAPKVADAGRA